VTTGSLRDADRLTIALAKPAKQVVEIAQAAGAL
jgi:hypothetical protein